MTKRFIITVGIMGVLSIIMGAFGAHIISGKISEKYMDIYNTGTDYLMFHALALLALTFMNRYISRAYLNTIYYFFVIGVVLFSGSLLVISLSELTGMGIGSLGILTPIGGLLLIIGWIILIFAGASYSHKKGSK